MLSAMGTEPGFGPDGSVAGEIDQELDIPGSTLSHHLQKLKHENLVDTEDLVSFLYAEPCTRNSAVKPHAVIRVCK